MTNRLGQEKSPYLQQHADNPVDWYPWGEEAFARARASDRPVLVSIGYSACHWCHVMAHESFEDPTTARIMNDRFVNIKVDREERPDVDSIYMEAVQTLTGQGGWPLNVFLTPEGEPFYGGTYFPSEPRYGMPSWRQVLEAVAGAYEGRRSEVTSSAAQLTQRIHQAQEPRISAEPLTPDILQAAYAGAKSQLDWENGGFGGAPKFPQPLALEFMLRMSRRLADEDGLRFVDLTLAKMAAGGIFDHLGGGFHRYTVDGQWVVPHFEKMLYDNALLSRVYLQAFQLTGDHRFRTVVEQTLDYLLRDMRSPEGGFCSAEDADSEGVEGKYYVWTPDDLSAVLDRDVVRVMALHYGVREGGNFEGATILTLSRSVEEIAHQIGATSAKVERMIEAGRRALLEARFRRVPPGKDTKILASWNALAIRALAEAGRTLGRVDYMEAAERAAGFILDAFFPRGVLVRSFNDGPSEIPAFLEDYAFLVEALLSLYEASFRTEYFLRARTLAGEMVERFWDEERRAFFDTVPGEHELVVRPRTVFDNPIPSGTAAAAFGLLRLEAHTGDTRYARHAAAAFHAARDLLPRAPQGFGYLLSALDFYLSSPLQVAIVGDREGDDTVRLVQPVFDRYLPNKVVAVGGEGDVPLLAGRSRNEGRATAYVCEHFSCRMPVTDERGLELQLTSLDASVSE